MGVCVHAQLWSHACSGHLAQACRQPTLRQALCWLHSLALASGLPREQRPPRVSAAGARMSEPGWPARACTAGRALSSGCPTPAAGPRARARARAGRGRALAAARGAGAAAGRAAAGADVRHGLPARARAARARRHRLLRRRPDAGVLHGAWPAPQRPVFCGGPPTAAQPVSQASAASESSPARSVLHPRALLFPGDKRCWIRFASPTGVRHVGVHPPGSFSGSHRLPPAHARRRGRGDRMAAAAAGRPRARRAAGGARAAGAAAGRVAGRAPRAADAGRARAGGGVHAGRRGHPAARAGAGRRAGAVRLSPGNAIPASRGPFLAVLGGRSHPAWPLQAATEGCVSRE
jgi:hypothetical protein